MACRYRNHRDHYYHGTRKIQKISTERPSICASDLVRKECPISCQVKRACYSQGALTGGESHPPPDNEGKPEMQVWQRTMNIEPPNKASTLCLSRDVDFDQMMEDCRNWNNKARKAYIELYLACATKCNQSAAQERG